MDGLISHYVLDDGRLVVAHAGLKEAYHGRSSGRVRSFALYGDTTGETDEFGLPVRYPWAREYRGAAMVVYGHTPVPEAEWVNNTICLDTGVVFGGALTALRYPERELVAVPAEQQWYEPVAPAGAPAPGRARADRAATSTTSPAPAGWRPPHAGKVKVPEENAAAALEVMSRFAVDPRWLVYLPPTMAPAADLAPRRLPRAPRAGLRRSTPRPASPQVVCEEKHMGSRAIAVVCPRRRRRRRAGSASTDGTSGAVYTRTGRPFFADRAVHASWSTRLRGAVAPLFDELDTDWLVLDGELLPWSAKALGLIRDQYASVGRRRAHRAARPPSTCSAAAAARGLDVGDARGRAPPAGATTPTRSATPTPRYCRPDATALDGVTLAPFQVLAAEGRALALTEPHPWHLERLGAPRPTR